MVRERRKEGRQGSLNITTIFLVLRKVGMLHHGYKSVILGMTKRLRFNAKEDEVSKKRGRVWMQSEGSYLCIGAF